MGSWSGAVCTPSRHMVMSGRTVWHLPRNGIRNAGPNPLCPEDLPDHTLAAVFNRAGSQHEARSTLPGKGIDALLRGPLCRRVVCDIEVNDPSPIVTENDEDEENSKRGGW